MTSPEVRMSFGTIPREHVSRCPSKASPDNPELHKLIEPHIMSFNAITDQYLLDNAVKNLDTRSVLHASSGLLVRIWLDDVQIGKPMLPEQEVFSIDRRIFPAECRQRGCTYAGQMIAKICFQLGSDGEIYSFNRHLGDVPIMVRSNRCHLEGLSPAALISRHEEPEEYGGYFIVNGIEKLIRLLIVNRGNYPLAVHRPAYTKKGPNYTPYGIVMRCVRDDSTSQTISLHYLSDVGITVRISLFKQEYLVPVLLILRALGTLNDKQIFEGVTLNGSISDAGIRSRLETMLRAHRITKVYSQNEALEFLGARFQAVLRYDDEMSELEIGMLLLRKYFLVHLENNQEKITLLFMMIRKLLALVGGLISPENTDALMSHEVLLPGHFYVGFLKEKFDELLTSLKIIIFMDGSNQAKRKAPADEITDNPESFFRRMLSRAQLDIGKKMRHVLATGNVSTTTGMDLLQTSGYSIIAERLNNLRSLSHFRSVHRGAFFATVKTTLGRKLLPEAWGFICPVHTPDGEPCGLITHLAYRTIIVCDSEVPQNGRAIITSFLLSLGMMVQPSFPLEASAELFNYEVMIDGTLVGWIPSASLVSLAASQLRQLKGRGAFPKYMEVAEILPSSIPSQQGVYPGLFIFTSAGRLMRPIERAASAEEEFIGTLEQVYLPIALPSCQYTSSEEIIASKHREISSTAILSVVANLTPFCDFNQSPRNMYQCQMAKQTMGTSCYTLPFRSDNKTYRLQSCQSPIVRTRLYDKYQMDSYPNGTNAVVAVISYTGYDMEDAMIINKSAVERGFANGSIYKTDLIELDKDSNGKEEGFRFFSCTNPAYLQSGKLEPDGFPPIGRIMRPDDPFYSYILVRSADNVILDERVVYWRADGLEEAYIDSIRLIGDDTGRSPGIRALITLRIPRTPVIGDKFSSRHGQKGVCSQRWPLIDMPFSEIGGITPDIIINPHAFPSRMTIGMFIESMAGKAGAMLGHALDATPFQLTGKAVETFGEMLTQAGFSYYGSEPLYSGIFGTEFSADIFIGCVYYQRLRHMVSDKFQVRTLGPIHNLTRQPIKGRKRAGGIRFGEMERDSMLAHGAAFLLHDRLVNCSDYTQMHACRNCGDILSIMFTSHSSSSLRCLDCGTSGPSSITVVALPFVYRYLVTELMAMNVKVKMEISATH